MSYDFHHFKGQLIVPVVANEKIFQKFKLDEVVEIIEKYKGVKDKLILETSKKIGEEKAQIMSRFINQLKKEI